MGQLTGTEKSSLCKQGLIQAQLLYILSKHYIYFVLVICLFCCWFGCSFWDRVSCSLGQIQPLYVTPAMRLLLENNLDFTCKCLCVHLSLSLIRIRTPICFLLSHGEAPPSSHTYPYFFLSVASHGWILIQDPEAENFILKRCDCVKRMSSCVKPLELYVSACEVSVEAPLKSCQPGRGPGGSG